MSLNKIPPLPGGEEVGYDLKLNVGCDALKCNTINGEPYPDPNGLVYQEPIDPTAPSNINAGALCYFQNTDDPKNVTKTNYIKVETATTGGGGQLINMANSPLINASNITNEVIDPKYTLTTVPEGSTTSNIAPDRRSVMGHYIYSPRSTLPLIPTQVNVNSIKLSDEQVARDTTYYYKFTCDNVGLIINGGATVTPPSYPFVDNYAISPAFNECIEAVYVFRKATLSWVRCKQTT